MRRTIPAFLLSCVLLAHSASAQEAMYTAAATMPSPHTGVVREQFHYYRFGSNPNDASTETDVYELTSSLAYGLTRGLALFVDVPVEFENEHAPAGSPDGGWDKGIADIDAMLKYRFYKSDTGGVDTLRAALMAGASFASGDDHDFSSQSINPHAGVVATWVKGRHGLNGEFHFFWNTGGTLKSNLGGEGPSDALRLNGSYLYRIHPAAYTADSKGAWYITSELNYLYESTADHDLRFSPGLMFEGWKFAFEIMAQLPLYQEVDHRPEMKFGIGIGVRIAF